MRQAIRFLLLGMMTVVAMKAFSQMPVQVTPQLLPPYSLQVSEYYGGVQPKLQVLLINRDINQPNIQVKLRMTVESQNCRLRTKDNAQTPTLTLTNGIPYYLSPQELQPFFSAANIDFTGGYSEQEYVQTGRFPEGLYSFYFEAFELYSGNLVSNKGFSLAWLTLADPPLLNTPAKAEGVAPASPQNIIFNWTPRHNTSPTAAYFTDYVFTLVEYNDTQLGPEASFTSSPPLYIDSVQATTMLFGPGHPQLVPGKRYAWRVQAKAKNGAHQLAMFRNNGFSEVHWFTYQNNCAIPLGISATVQGQRVTIEWQNNIQHLDYKVEYREKNNQEAQWFTVNNTLPRVMLTDLKPGTQYEYRVGGACMVGQFSYSALLGFTTSGANANYLPGCGDSTLPAQGSGNTLQVPLVQGDVIKAGSFDVIVGYSTGTGSYSGTGYVIVPWLANAKVEVRFTSITLALDKKLLTGIIETTYDPSESGIDDIDEYVDIFTSGYGVGGVVSGEVTADTTFGFVIKIPDGITVQLPTGYIPATGLGQGAITISVIPQGGGIPVSYTVDQLPTTLKDKDGNLYQVNKQGQVVPLGKPGGMALLDKTNTKNIDVDKAVVKFVDYQDKQVYAFDEWKAAYKNSSTFNKEYERLNGDYYVSAKAIAPGKTDYLKAVVTITDNSIIADSIKFVNGKGTIYSRTKLSNGVYEIAVVGGPEKDAQEVYALYEQAGAKTLNFGKVLVASYPKRDFTINLVPINVGQFNINAQVIADSINKVYNKINVSFTVKMQENFADLSWDATGNGLDVKGSGFFSDLTSEMKSLNALYRKKVKTNPNEIYLFLLNQASDTLVFGDMPRGRQFGYVFLQGNDKINKIISHEIGHGKFSLKHIKDYGIDDTQLSNVMSYPPGNKLSKYQWDNIHDPAIVVSAFNNDESNLYEEYLQADKKQIIVEFNADNTEPPAEGDPAFYYFFDGAGNKYKINKTKIDNCNVDYFGVLRSFNYNGKKYVYCTSIKDGSFTGYYGDECTNASGIKSQTILGRFDASEAQKVPGCFIDLKKNIDFVKLPNEKLENVNRFDEFLRAHKNDLINNTQQIKNEIREILQKIPPMSVWYEDIDASNIKTDLKKFLETLKEIVKNLEADKTELTKLINDYYIELKKIPEFSNFDPNNPSFSAALVEKARSSLSLYDARCAISQFFQNRALIWLVNHDSYTKPDYRRAPVVLQALTQLQRLQTLNIFYQSPELTSTSMNTTGYNCWWANFGEEIVVGILRYASEQDKVGILNLLKQNKSVLPYFYKKIDNKVLFLGGDNNFDQFVKELVVLTQLGPAVDIESHEVKIVTWNPDLQATEFDVYDGVKFDDEGNISFYRVKADVADLVVGLILPTAFVGGTNAISTEEYGSKIDPLQPVALVLTKPSPTYFPSLSTKQEDYPITLTVPAISVAHLVNKKSDAQIKLYADVVFTVISFGQMAMAKNGLQFVWRATQTLVQATATYLHTENGQVALLNLFNGDAVKRDEFMKKFGFLETAITLGMVGEGVYTLLSDIRGTVYKMEQIANKGPNEVEALTKLENTIDEFETAMPVHLKTQDKWPNLGVLSYASGWLKMFGNSGCGKWFNNLVNQQKLWVKNLGNKVEYYFKSTKYGDDEIKLASVTEEGGTFKVTRESNGVPENFDPTDIEAATDDIAGLGNHADGAAVVCANGSCEIKLGGCFVAGTMVQTPGGLKAIESLNAGDEVITYDSVTRKNIHKHIIATSKKAMSFLRSIVVGKDTIIATPGHLIHTSKGWLEAALITSGMLISNSAESFVQVDTAYTIEATQAVYNFEVEDNHNYYVGEQQLLVHNGIGCNDKLSLVRKAEAEDLAKLEKGGEDFSTLLNARNRPGNATGNGREITGKWLKGTDGNAGLFPKSVADKLRGKSYNNFDDFRKDFWKAVADDPALSKQFSSKNLALMRNGESPFAVKSQWLGERGRYELHHKKPISQGGDVYSVDNLYIVTPRFHKDILSPRYHKGYDY